MKFTFDNRSVDVPIVISGLFFVLFISILNAAGTLPQLFFYIVALAFLVYNRFFYFPVNMALLVAISFVIINSSLVTDGNGLAYSFSFIRPFIEGVIVANLFYSIFAIDAREKIIKLIKYYVSFQMLFYLVMFLFPLLRTELLHIIYSSADYQIPAFQDAIQFRGYGISKHHLFGLPLAIATVATILFFNSKENIIGKFLYLGLCTILVVFNARIGLASIIISMFFLLFTLRYKDLRFISSVLLFAILAIVILSCLPFDSYSDNPRIVEWLTAGFTQFFENKPYSSTISDLETMLHFPDSIWGGIFGRGFICEFPRDCYSDIGFVRLISLAGILLLGITLFIYWEVCKKISWLEHSSCKDVAGRNYKQKVLSLSLFAIFLLATIKGDSYFSSDFSRLLITLALLSSLAKRKYHEAVPD